MKISLKWLADYVELPSSVEELTHRLTMAGLEVEGVHNPGGALAGVVVAEVLESQKHPNADKLSVTRVSCGGPAPLQIVCGAKNYRVGDKVPLAMVGTKLPNGTEIKQAALRGVDSSGMLCSARELGLDADALGLLILDSSLAPGLPIAQALGLDDVVLELNVTPNRADALSHLGVAREVATLLGRPLKLPLSNLTENAVPAASKVAVRIEDETRCWRYAARVIEGVTVKPSPRWMQERLKACGVRAINNLVDVTNYVLLEYGQPLHAFDLDEIAGAQIVVRTARAGEELKTLDGQVRRLHAEDLLICDRDKGQVLAGVMGGATSEVTATTTRVLLECAAFQPAAVRRSAKRHGLHTESSHRFERGTDIGAVREVLDRAAALMVEVAGGAVLSGVVDAFPAPRPPRVVTLRTQRVAQVLGVAVPEAECAHILTSLGFERRAAAAGQADYVVPWSRVDVSIEEDLIEEVARIRGYELVPPVLPGGGVTLEPEKRSAAVERRLRGVLGGQGLSEVINYSFVAPAELEAFQATAGAIVVTNPLSIEQSVMRTTLYPSLVQNVVRASRHQSTGVRFYELARTYAQDEEGGESLRPVARETLELAGALWGQRSGRRGWTSGDASVDFYDCKGAVEALLAALRVESVKWSAFESPWYHPRAAAQLLWKGGRIGSVGELHPRAAKRLQAPGGVFLFQLEVAALEDAATLVPRASELSRFPAVLRDLAVVVPEAMESEEVRGVILEVGTPLVEDANLFDVYRGPQVGEGQKNIAYALRYRSPDRTLNDAEVAEAHQRIVAEVTRRLGGTLRMA
jgi:phenylalanyl-tRNA synthetase beta chain